MDFTDSICLGILLRNTQNGLSVLVTLLTYFARCYASRRILIGILVFRGRSAVEDFKLFISLIEGTNDLIHSITPEGEFEFVNRAWLETLGYDGNEIKNIKLKNILFPGQIKKHQDQVESVFNGESLSDVEITFLTKEGDLVYCEGNLFPHREQSKISAVHGFFRNVTERRKTEEALNEAKARTEFFVDLMVHDITNIHQEVLSTFEILLLTPEFPSELAAFVNEGLTEMERASHLISNVRKITRLYTIQRDERMIDLANAISIAMVKVQNEFPKKELLVTTTIVEGQYLIKADEYLDDVFYGLLHNSVKFDTKDKVRVEIDVGLVQFTPFLRIQVRDQGPGISDADKEEIFNRLTHRKEKVMGLGLGLTLVKKIIENYGGYISVQDAVEGDHTKGTNFTILLRYQQPGQNHMEEEA